MATIKIDTRELRLREVGKTATVVFLKNKGGVGCTTNAYNFATWMAMRGYKVCLLDGDAQGDCTALCRVKHQPGMYNLLVNGMEFDDVWVGIPGTIYDNPHGILYLVPSDEASGKDIAQRVSAGGIAQRLQELEGRFDLVVVDTPPTASETNAGWYASADCIVYPTQCQAEPINAMKRSMTNYGNYAGWAQENEQPIAKILGILPTMFRGSQKLQHQLKGWLMGRYDDWVMPEIRDLTAWQQAAARRLPVWVYAPKSAAAAEAVTVYERFERGIYD